MKEISERERDGLLKSSCFPGEGEHGETDLIEMVIQGMVILGIIDIVGRCRLPDCTYSQSKQLRQMQSTGHQTASPVWIWWAIVLLALAR